MKKFSLIPIFLCKLSWNFDRKNKCNNILNSWKMAFQVSDNKEQHFIELLDDDLNPIKLSIANVSQMSYSLLWDAWTLTIFIFLFFYFSDFILIFFFFSFISLLDNEEAHDTTVTWHVTWCDVIGLEHGGRVWKITSGHIKTTW